MVEIPKLPRLNYDDYYKFLTSFSLVIFILSVIGASYVTARRTTYAYEYLFWESFLFYVTISIVGAITFFWAMNKWKKRQELFDKMVDIELSNKAADLQKKMQELVRSMDIRNKREEQINDSELEYVQHKINKLKKR